MADVPARIALAVVAVALAVGMAIQLHAHALMHASVAELGREIGHRPDPAANRRALDQAMKVVDLRPGSGALFVAIGLQERAGHPAAAERLALRAVEREPKNFSSWLTLGLIRQSSGDRAGAAAAFAQARRLNPLYRTPR